MDRDLGEIWQDANHFQCRLPSAFIHVIVGEGRGACHVHPMSFLGYIQPVFILKNDLSLGQRRFDMLLHRSQRESASV